MSRTARALLLAAVCGSAAGTARADVIYSFTGTSSFSAPYGSGTFTPQLTLSLDITNAAVQSGAFILNGSEESYLDPSLDYSGDVGEWISASGNALGGAQLSPTVVPPGGQFALALTFDPTSGAVTNTNFESAFSGGDGAALNGTGAAASGYIGADAPQYALCGAAGGSAGQGSRCFVSGSWTEAGYVPGASVPEPASLAMLAAGVLGFAAMRRHST